MEYVDLGLPSGNLWAKCNIGATTEDEAGLYFQWGDINGYTKEQVGKDKQFASDFSDYKFGTRNNLTKYNTTDGKVVLDLEDDAAHVILGEGWRMPTKDDFVELCQQTDMFIVPTEGEEVAVTVTANERHPIYFEFETATTATAKAFKFYKKGDHSTYISVPFVGSAFEGFVRFVSEVCYLWSSSLFSGDAQLAFYWACDAPYGFGVVNDVSRYGGYPVRGIKKKEHNLKEIKTMNKNEENNNNDYGEPIIIEQMVNNEEKLSSYYTILGHLYEMEKELPFLKEDPNIIELMEKANKKLEEFNGLYKNRIEEINAITNKCWYHGYAFSTKNDKEEVEFEFYFYPYQYIYSNGQLFSLYIRLGDCYKGGIRDTSFNIFGDGKGIDEDFNIFKYKLKFIECSEDEALTKSYESIINVVDRRMKKLGK